MSTWLTVRPARNIHQTLPVWHNSAFNDPFLTEAVNWWLGNGTRQQSASPTPTNFGLNIAQDETNYYVWAVLPGVDADKLEISALENKLTIAGEVSAAAFAPVAQSKETTTEGDDQPTSQTEAQPTAPQFKWLQRELPTSNTRFQRQITLPTNINPETVEASYDNGILRLVVPQAPEVRARRITVQKSRD